MTRGHWILPLAALALGGCGSKGKAPPAAQMQPAPGPSSDASVGRAVKVMIVNMFVGEAQPFIMGLGLTQHVPVSGLTTDAPDVLCNADDVCELTIGMGYANAATSITALLYRGGFDLTHTYFVIAGIAGIDPLQGTVGSAAWARYLVDFGTASEIDAREMPAGWPYGYFGIGSMTTTDAPPSVARTQVYQLNEDLLQQAYALSKGVTLEDSPSAVAFRAKYSSAPANLPPTVVQCDSASGDTWFAGTALTTRARDWTKLMTGGKGVFCTSQQEDNATLEALTRGAAAGKVDVKRVAALRTASDISAPYAGQADTDGLIQSLEQGGLTTSTDNLLTAARPLIDAIVQGWDEWQLSVPKP